MEWGGCFRTISLDRGLVLSCWNNTIAVGSQSGKIIMLSAVTGSQMAVLSGHIDHIGPIVFSSDGRSLVSGSSDKTVKLWDMQTGGVVKTYVHRDWVTAVSISMDCTRIASGSLNCEVCLWDVQTEECLCTIQQQANVCYVSFSPLNPQQIISVSGHKIWEWDIDGHQIPSTYDGFNIIFSPDHTQFALCNGTDVTVHNTYSRTIVAKFNVTNNTHHYCFSPDGRLIAAADEQTAYVWDITSQEPYLIETFIVHISSTASLVFSSPSSLVSVSYGGPAKFWKIGALSKDTATTNVQHPPILPVYNTSISLQARDGIAISSDEAGIVKEWDISTGVCKASFQTPAGDAYLGLRDAKLIDNRLVFVWYEGYKIYIWEAEKGELHQTIDTPLPTDLRILGDTSKIICLFDGIVRAWSMWTWELVCEIKLDLRGSLYLDSLCTYSPRIWICSWNSLAQEGWDFGTLDSSPTPFDPSIGRPHLDFIIGTKSQARGPSWIKDSVTGRKVFQLSAKYATPSNVQWDGRFLVAGYYSGKVLILDFHHILTQNI